jgi:methylmalonyl-CoA mutase N-terminal domain/subunit
MRDRFHATNQRSWQLRFHTQTAGVSLTAQQPYNNVVRTALQAMAAVLGGTQSLHTNALDEALALPTAEAATLALRTQQILAEETGVANTVDPLGGSYFVEALTDRMEAEAWRLIRKIDELGGMVRALDAGFPQQEIADSGYRTQLQEDAGERVVVGVNRYVQPEEAPIPYLRVDEAVEREQIERVRAVKAARNAGEVARQLRRVADACRSGENLMPVLVDAVKAHASIGEIADVYRETLGRYREPIIF